MFCNGTCLATVTVIFFATRNSDSVFWFQYINRIFFQTVYHKNLHWRNDCRNDDDDDDDDYYYYYYYTRFKHIKSFTKVKNLKCERSQCHRRNAYGAVLSLVLKVAMLTVISEVTVSDSLFQTAGTA